MRFLLGFWFFSRITIFAGSGRLWMQEVSLSFYRRKRLLSSDIPEWKYKCFCGFRIIDEVKGTIVLMKRIFSIPDTTNDIIKILNAGFQREPLCSGRKSAGKKKGKSFAPTPFDVFSKDSRDEKKLCWWGVGESMPYFADDRTDSEGHSRKSWWSVWKRSPWNPQ